MKRHVDEAVVDEMDELLDRLKIVRDHLDRNNIDEAKSGLEITSRLLADLIHECR